MGAITVQSVASERILKASDALILALEATPEDKLHWKPMDVGRPVLNQVIECAFANMRWQAIIELRACTSIPNEVTAKIKAGFVAKIESGSWAGETVKQALRDATRQLSNSILAVPDDDLSIDIEMPAPWSETYRLVDCFNHPYWNMVYHLGQINYIQTLLGDRVDHSVF
jgi:hypothetical protein